MKRLEVSICLGSSCFARGNQHTVHLIKRFLDRYQLSQQVYFKGGHCFGKCKEGPVIKVGENYIYGYEEHNVIALLETELKAQNIKF